MKKSILNPILMIIAGVILVLATWVYAIMDYGTPDEFSVENWPKTEQAAKQATIEHFKKVKNVDIVIDEVSFSGEYATPEIYIDGHVANNKQQKIAATVNSSEHYQVNITEPN
ncbi:phosphoglycolate phosphatase [Paenibacillus sp. 481]|uniref:phosphoglycolate phosphatase n=1 Tax=Paenibacillus sp. 481 TaxID=2835869 RepID=UPI001E40F86F|nr:phosphoglycolate phosphatase [Paenibacillus sp. 481]UHA73209.1 phosphoglycolate phosphatase [Paenibacillus sp. 481]